MSKQLVLQKIEHLQNELKRIGISPERIDEHFDENRLMAMSSIIQFLTNCTTEQLEKIEAEFERSKKQP